MSNGEYITKKIDEYERIIPNDLMLQTDINTVNFKKFEEEIKAKMNLEKTVRLKKTLEMISVLENVITSIK